MYHCLSLMKDTCAEFSTDLEAGLPAECYSKLQNNFWPEAVPNGIYLDSYRSRETLTWPVWLWQPPWSKKANTFENFQPGQNWYPPLQVMQNNTNKQDFLDPLDT
jgi:hypothetical protein